MSAFEALMTELIDYAGLFPPAKLDMNAAAREYARHRAGPHAWMLGRFICPVARLDELARAAAEAKIGPFAATGDDAGSPPWEVSALTGPNLAADLDVIAAFVQRHAGRFDVPALEVKVDGVAALEAAAETLESVSERVNIFFEFPVIGTDFRGFIAALAGGEHGAKIRTGGLTADAFPSTETVARFITACRDADVSFKATAGLHHPLRHYHAGVGCKMHGFLNLFLAAALADIYDLDARDIQRVIDIEAAAAFRFDGEAVHVMGFDLTTEDLDAARTFAVSYGSCSFDEPLEDLKALGLLNVVAS